MTTRPLGSPRPSSSSPSAPAARPLRSVGSDAVRPSAPPGEPRSLVIAEGIPTNGPGLSVAEALTTGPTDDLVTRERCPLRGRRRHGPTVRRDRRVLPAAVWRRADRRRGPRPLDGGRPPGRRRRGQLGGVGDPLRFGRVGSAQEGDRDRAECDNRARMTLTKKPRSSPAPDRVGPRRRATTRGSTPRRRSRPTTSDRARVRPLHRQRVPPSKPRKTFTVINPATEEPLAKVAHASKADVGRAVAAAKEAHRSTWSKLPGRERAKYLYRIARILQERSASSPSSRA